ncbi:N-acetylmuramoyl-L-alanine amidase [Deinococcus planocerae]|uniref:N-acetylmuramoyl-L-alanine amidase n=1 Tax=Deinococcus planocerae TaxID=1737569 RepID=UPI000C7E8EFF|nr:N-acetylmuramoyl-L-alanine amidase [Deinococcus planocerae]
MPQRKVGERLLPHLLPAHTRRVLALVRSRCWHAWGVALDASEVMLDAARLHFAGEVNVTVTHHDLNAPLPDLRTFGAVVSGFALHHLPDERKRTLYGEMRACLAPGGVALLRGREDGSHRLAPAWAQVEWPRGGGRGVPLLIGGGWNSPCWWAGWTEVRGPHPSASRGVVDLAMPLRRVFLSLALLAVPVLTAARAAPEVFVAYPPEGHRVAFDHVILEGSVPPGAGLRVGNQAVAVGQDGLFMLWWPLRVGTNDLRLVTTLNGQTGARTLRVIRTATGPLPATPTTIDRKSVTPAVPHEFWDTARDSPDERAVPVSFRGSPGGRAAYRVGTGPWTPLREVEPGRYEAEYVVPVAARFENTAVTVRLTGRDGRGVTATAPGRLTSTGEGPRTGTQRPGTVRGLGLNEGGGAVTTLEGRPFLYPRDGMTFTLVGRVGEDVRARLAPGVSVLVTAKQLDVTDGAPTLAPSGEVTLDAAPAEATTPPVTLLPALPFTPLTPANPPNGGPAAPSWEALRLRLPLSGARIPFTVAQEGEGRRLTLTLYGLGTPPILPAPLTDPLVARVTAEPAALGVTRLSLDLTAPQRWGFTANYDGDDLLLTVRRPPTLDPARPLAGRVIVVDPGHGGTQFGGAGSLRVPEKDLVLPIARRVAELLRDQGAEAVLTRDADVTLGLYERDLLAEERGADLLVSIHANALPDGRDPRGIRGPEVYFTHPQAQAPAAAILAALRRTLPDLGPGQGLKPGADLALTRPTTQPSLLVETAYLTDPGNLRLLMDPGGRERFAQAIAAGIADFYAEEARGD